MGLSLKRAQSVNVCDDAHEDDHLIDMINDAEYSFLIVLRNYKKL